MELKADKDNPAEQRLLEVFNEQASASLKAHVAARVARSLQKHYAAAA